MFLCIVCCCAFVVDCLCVLFLTLCVIYFVCVFFLCVPFSFCVCLYMRVICCVRHSSPLSFSVLCLLVHTCYMLRVCFLPFLVLFVDVGVACLFGVVLLLVFET